MKKQKIKKRALTRSYLLNATYSYLQKFATTEKNLMDVLDRKVRRRLPDTDHEDLYAEAKVWIAEIVEKSVKQGLVNDQTFAETRANSLLRSGNSKMKITQKLLAKGVSSEVVSDVMNILSEHHEDIDLLAAVKYARKRRFGAFSIRHDGEEVMEKELASMCRAGFSYGLARRILTMNYDDLDKILYGVP